MLASNASLQLHPKEEAKEGVKKTRLDPLVVAVNAKRLDVVKVFDFL